MDLLLTLSLPIIIGIMIIVSYNGIISAHNIVNRSWSDIANYEKQKVNILDSMTPVVEKYASHESSTLKDITALRQNIIDLGNKDMDVDTLSKVQQGTDQLMKGMSITLENYPDLKANTMYLDLMSNIKSQHENVGAAISIFNRNVEIFNSKIESIPTNIVNGLFTKKSRIREFRDSITDQNIEYRPNL